MTNAIETDGLTKRFASVAVVDAIDLRVPTGSVYGFLGPNGSGKTTTIRMLLGLIAPNAGSAALLGRPVADGKDSALERVGSVIEGPAFYPWLSGRQNLVRFDRSGRDQARATRSQRVDAALERVGLTAAAGKRYKAYSLGMRQRLSLALALLRPRELLILDEPTNGMDPQGTREIRALIRELAADGSTVFLSSHLLAEVEQICTHIGIMRVGRLVAQAPIAELEGAATPRVRVETVTPDRAAEILTVHGLVSQVHGDVVTADLDHHEPEALCRALVEGGVGVRGFGVERPSLEDVYVGLTGEGFDVPR